MRAWQFTEIDTPLQLVELKDPIPGAGEIVVKTGAVGLCHSDIGFLDGTITALLGKTPIVLGHEVVGTVAAVGPGVSEFAIGDRVGIPATTDGPGTAIDGGYAEMVRVPARLPVHLPDGLAFDVAVPATCAGRTAYRAVHTAGKIEAGMKVGLIGFGGLGYFGLQIVQAAGASAFVAELHESRWDLARELGARDCATDLRAFEAEGLDLVIDFAGAANTLNSAINAVKPGGRIVEVGLFAETGTVSIPQITMKEVTIVGSSNGTREEARAVLELVAEGSVTPKIEPIGFESIAEGLDRLDRGETDGRLVVTF